MKARLSYSPSVLAKSFVLLAITISAFVISLTFLDAEADISTLATGNRPPDFSIPGAAARLAGAIQIPTVSPEDPDDFDGDAFTALHEYLKQKFPSVHAQLDYETVGTHSLLYTWPGSDAGLKPILLAGHLDVVPIEPGTDSQWQQPPFSGRITDGFIWGRGSVDNKSAVLGTLEAVELLLKKGYRPRRTVLLAYGHDEELGGVAGAKQIATLLRSRGIELEMVLDEGGVIGEGVLPGITAPIALVGIAEKGFASIELSTRTAGGHSSLPPRETAIGILSMAITQLEQNPMPVRLERPTHQLFERLAPQFSFVQRTLLSNLWLTKPLVIRRLEDNPTTNAMVRTTTATTMFHAGTKDNVLPTQARAVVNFRILTGDSVAGVVEYVRTIVDDDRIEVRVAGAFSAEPSSISGTDSENFRLLERTIRSVHADAIVAPYLVVVATDSRYYADLSKSVFRFLPLRLTTEDLSRMHGINERISVSNYENAIRTYHELILNTTGR